MSWNIMADAGSIKASMSSVALGSAFANRRKNSSKGRRRGRKTTRCSSCYLSSNARRGWLQNERIRRHEK